MIDFERIRGPISRPRCTRVYDDFGVTRQRTRWQCGRYGLAKPTRSMTSACLGRRH